MTVVYNIIDTIDKIFVYDLLINKMDEFEKHADADDPVKVIDHLLTDMESEMLRHPEIDTIFQNTIKDIENYLKEMEDIKRRNDEIIKEQVELERQRTIGMFKLKQREEKLESIKTYYLKLAKLAEIKRSELESLQLKKDHSPSDTSKIIKLKKLLTCVENGFGVKFTDANSYYIIGFIFNERTTYLKYFNYSISDDIPEKLWTLIEAGCEYSTKVPSDIEFFRIVE